MLHNDRITDLNTSQFTLDFSGVAGFFGGDVAVAAMSTVHLYRGRKWLGWYNSPGSYEVAKAYGQLAKSRFWDGIYPGPNLDPTQFFGLAGQPGPKYRGFHSGTFMEKTGHIACLLTQCAQEIPDSDRVTVEGRKTKPMPITIVDLISVPEKTMTPKALHSYSPILAAFPILATVAAAIACGLFGDWFCFAMIVTGALSSGISCLVIGLATLKFNHPEPANGAPPGDGILDDGSNFVILLGQEGAVNSVTRGNFELEFSSAPNYHDIGICSLSLTAQFLTQLLLVAQGTLFGQLMFLASLGVSWAYNSYLCSLNRQDAQKRLLKEGILGNPQMKQFVLGTRTAAVVFAALVLAQHHAAEQATSSAHNVQVTERATEAKRRTVEKVLLTYLPNDTDDWNKWREIIVPKIVDPSLFRPSQPEKTSTSNEKKEDLLTILLRDADTAFQGYREYEQYRKGVESLGSSSPNPPTSALANHPSLLKRVAFACCRGGSRTGTSRYPNRTTESVDKMV